MLHQADSLRSVLFSGSTNMMYDPSTTLPTMLTHSSAGSVREGHGAGSEGTKRDSLGGLGSSHVSPEAEVEELKLKLKTVIMRRGYVLHN